MGKRIRDVIAGLPKERQEKIERGAEAMAKEMITEFDSLEALRKAHGKTQTQLAQTLGIGQNAVSQLERRTDLYVSTLRKYVSALGGELEISFRTKKGARIMLNDFHPWESASARAAAKGKMIRSAARSAGRTGAAPNQKTKPSDGRAGSRSHRIIAR